MTRRGLVLGGGGVLGAAWTVGALTALEEQLGIDAREFDEFVGTSAGSVLAALLACGAGVAQLREHQLGGEITAGPLVGFHYDHDNAAGGSRPTRPRAALGAPAVLRRGVSGLRRLPPTTVISSFLPLGTGRLDRVGALVRHVAPSGWAPRPGLTVVALDYDASERISFGRKGFPEVDLADAVMASCAIPAWYEPVMIGGRRYVDGGAWSSTNIDLVAGLDLDEVYVLAPAVTFDPDTPTRAMTRLERRWRSRVTRRALIELAEVHRGGTHVTLLGPSSVDLEVMGHNAMAAQRRIGVLQTSLHTSRVSLGDPHHLTVDQGHAPQEPDHPDEVTAYTAVSAEERVFADGAAYPTASQQEGQR
ncbi:MAG: patatin-like phospholipase family protein [Actinomycetales bacterium]|jgi:NTE family protein|nr:patatin-like phospholipase family protein [Candidatus Phosphoribacter baldrii]